ncbi:MAG: ankyrin repeat domain-containing protein [Rubripirellula sp.]
MSQYNMHDLELNLRNDMIRHLRDLDAAGVSPYGYAIIVDPESMAVSGATNSPGDIAVESDNNFYSYLKYTVPEWSSANSQAFAASNELIDTMLDPHTGHGTREQILDTCLQALLKLKDENAFSIGTDAPFLLIWVEDGYHPFTAKSIGLLNTGDHVQELADGLMLDIDAISGTTSAISQLFDALGTDDTENALRLLAEEPSLKDQTKISGRTPLHQSAFCGNAAIARRLIESGADLNARNAGGFTPLFYSCAPIDETVGLLLIENKCDVTATDKDGMTALHLAADMGKMKIADAILQNGGDVNALDQRGETPLDKASAQGWDPMVQFLSDRGGVRGEDTAT